MGPSHSPQHGPIAQPYSMGITHTYEGPSHSPATALLLLHDLASPNLQWHRCIAPLSWPRWVECPRDLVDVAGALNKTGPPWVGDLQLRLPGEWGAAAEIWLYDAGLHE